MKHYLSRNRGNTVRLELVSHESMSGQNTVTFNSFISRRVVSQITPLYMHLIDFFWHDLGQPSSACWSRASCQRLLTETCSVVCPLNAAVAPGPGPRTDGDCNGGSRANTREFIDARGHIRTCRPLANVPPRLLARGMRANLMNWDFCLDSNALKQSGMSDCLKSITQSRHCGLLGHNSLLGSHFANKRNDMKERAQMIMTRQW